MIENILGMILITWILDLVGLLDSTTEFLNACVQGEPFTISSMYGCAVIIGVLISVVEEMKRRKK